METLTLSFSKPVRLTAELVGGGGGNDNTGLSGKGGLVKAYKDFTAGSSITMYIYVGGGGQSNCAAHGGGWNGGGDAGSFDTSGEKSGHSGCGGGATDIRIGGQACGYNTSTSSEITDDNRILVAGGGGGASSTNGSGGAGGKLGVDGAGSHHVKWKGLDKDKSGKHGDGGGGGGGYYGGTSGVDNASGGTGGSNYIDTDSGWVQIENGSSSNGATIGYSDADKRDFIFPGWAIVTYTYK